MSKVKFITTFNPALPSIEGVVRKNIHYLNSDVVLKRPVQIIHFQLFINVTKT